MLAELKRLRRMDAPEIGWRLREKLLAGMERAAVRVGAADESDAAFLRCLRDPRRNGSSNGAGAAAREPALDFLRRSMAPRFHLPTDPGERAGLAGTFRRRFAGRLPEIEAEAGRLCAHRIELLGHGELDCGEEIDWHRDPVTGRVWERRFWGDYDLVRDAAAGDPKVVLELNRHQHLPRLAKAWFLLGEERYAAEAVAQLLGWIDQNPPGVGVHWHSALDVALRAVSWTWTLAFLLGSEALDEPAARRIVKSLFAQLDHVRRYPSLYSSPNTHLLGEAAALYVAGSAFGGCARGRAWRARGEELLAAELERQVGDDGGHAELSPWYHCYALDFALQAVAIARRNGRHLPAPAVHRVEGMLDFLLHLVRPDGTLPRIGDDDGGRALALGRTDYGRPVDLLAVGAALFGRGTLKTGAALGEGGAEGGACEEVLWLLGEAGLDELDALPEAPPEPSADSFPDAGYFIQRSGWNADDSHLVFDCGGLGRLGGGHGHADALSISLFAGGAELLVDPGTYRYNGAPEWRDYFRSTAAHNTVVIDGRDQSVPGDTFRWRRQAETRLLADARFEGVEYLAGEHDGYAGEPAGVIHRRRVLFVRPDYWLVFDDFRGPGDGASSNRHEEEHDYELLYHLPPGSSLSPVEYGGGRREAALRAVAGRPEAPSGLDLALHASAPLEVRAVEGASPPTGPRGRPQGWVSRRYGERRPAPVATARFRAAAPAAAITVLLPAAGAGGRLRAGARGWGETADGAWSVRPVPVENGCAAALGIAVRHPGGEDLAVLSPDGGDFEAESLRGRGELFWARRDGATGRLLAVRADACEVDGVPVLEATPPFHFHRGNAEREEPIDVRYRRVP